MEHPWAEGAVACSANHASVVMRQPAIGLPLCPAAIVPGTCLLCADVKRPGAPSSAVSPHTVMFRPPVVRSFETTTRSRASQARPLSGARADGRGARMRLMLSKAAPCGPSRHTDNESLSPKWHVERTHITRCRKKARPGFTSRILDFPGARRYRAPDNMGRRSIEYCSCQAGSIDWLSRSGLREPGMPLLPTPEHRLTPRPCAPGILAVRSDPCRHGSDP